MWFRLQTSAGEAELPPDCAIAQWQTHLDEASRLFSKRLNVASELRACVVDAGFEAVADEVLRVPIGPWPRDPRLKEQGRFLQVQMLDSIEPISLAYCTRILK